MSHHKKNGWRAQKRERGAGMEKGMMRKNLPKIEEARWEAGKSWATGVDSVDEKVSQEMPIETSEATTRKNRGKRKTLGNHSRALYNKERFVLVSPDGFV